METEPRVDPTNLCLFHSLLSIPLPRRLNSFSKYLWSLDCVHGTLLGAGFKVMSKTVVNVAHKLPTDSNGVGEVLCQRAVGKLLIRPGVREGLLLQAPSSLTWVSAAASKWSLHFHPHPLPGHLQDN